MCIRPSKVIVYWANLSLGLSLFGRDLQPPPHLFLRGTQDALVRLGVVVNGSLPIAAFKQWIGAHRSHA
jgi:hypothetical protein